MRHDVPEREYGAGYGGGYGRSGEYGERGGRGRWGGQDAGASPDYDRARFSDESSDYGGYGASSGFDRGGGERGRDDRPRERNDAGATYGSGGGAGWGTTGAYGAGRGYGGQGERWRNEPSFAGRGPRNYRRSDERIEDEVNEALTRHPGLDATDVEARVRNGEVTLTGRVESREAKRMADDAADSVFGVVDVVNQLRIDRGESEATSMADREVSRTAARESGAATSRQADGDTARSAEAASRAESTTNPPAGGRTGSRNTASRGGTTGRRSRS